MASKGTPAADDDPLVERIRAAFAGNPMTEQRMFGGVGFMLGGNMVAGTLRRELLVRVGKDGHDAAMKRPAARAMEHGGRAVTGYIVVGSDGTRSDKDLKSWLDLALAHVATLPPKKSGPAKTRVKKPAGKRDGTTNK